MIRRWPWHNLRFRLVAWYSLLTGLSMVVSNGLFYYEFRQLLLAEVDSSLEVTAIQARKNLDDEVDGLEFDPRPDAPALTSLLNDAGVEIYLRSQDGTVKERFGDALILSAKQDVSPGFKTISTPSGRWRTYSQEISPRNGRTPGWLTVARSLQPVDSTLSNVFRRHLLKLPFLLGIVGLGGLFLANRALKPIGQIAQMTRQVRISGDLTQRIHYQGTADDELARLATMFDEMLDSIQLNFEQQKRFTADASHELRTPLTTLKGRLQVALSQPRSTDNYVATLQSIEHEVDRLIRLSADLLLLSRLEQDHQAVDFELVDLSDYLAAIAAQIQPLAELKKLDFVTHIAPGLRVFASPDHLIRLFLNLLDNAVKYTPDQGRVVLEAATRQQAVVVSVSDNGIGISRDHLPHLFERFYRVEKSRSRSMGGTGLGLAIAQEIVHRHDGTISVDSQPGCGTTFSVMFNGSRGASPSA
jgi:two-component system, OmpR family, heavy metal sensor histidine kinase CusS